MTGTVGVNIENLASFYTLKSTIQDVSSLKSSVPYCFYKHNKWRKRLKTTVSITNLWRLANGFVQQKQNHYSFLRVVFFAQIFVSSVVKVKKFFSAILEINIYIIFPNVKKPDVVQGFSLSAWKNTIFAAQFSIKFGGT